MVSSLSNLCVGGMINPSSLTHFCCLSDGDEKIELAVGYSDRMIRLYKWQPATMTPTPPASGTDSEPKGSFIQFDKWQLAGQVTYCIRGYTSL